MSAYENDSHFLEQSWLEHELSKARIASGKVEKRVYELNQVASSFEQVNDGYISEIQALKDQLVSRTTYVVAALSTQAHL